MHTYTDESPAKKVPGARRLSALGIQGVPRLSPGCPLPRRLGISWAVPQGQRRAGPSPSSRGRGGRRSPPCSRSCLQMLLGWARGRGPFLGHMFFLILLQSQSSQLRAPRSFASWMSLHTALQRLTLKRNLGGKCPPPPRILRPSPWPFCGPLPLPPTTQGVQVTRTRQPFLEGSLASWPNS